MLKDAGVIFEENARNLFIVEGSTSAGPRLLAKDDDLELGASASPEEPSSSNSYSPPLPPPMLSENDVHNVSFKYTLVSKSSKNRNGNGKLENVSHKSTLRPTDSFYATGKNRCTFFDVRTMLRKCEKFYNCILLDAQVIVA